MWFQIPEYQCPYLWGYDQVHDLLDDLTFAMENKPEAEYFLGSLVFQAKPVAVLVPVGEYRRLRTGGKSLKALLAAAPLEGVELRRSRETGRIVDFECI